MYKAPASMVNNRGYAVFEMHNKYKEHLPLDAFYDKPKLGSSNFFYTKKLFIHGRTAKYFIVSLDKEGKQQKIKTDLVADTIY